MHQLTVKPFKNEANSIIKAMNMFSSQTVSFQKRGLVDGLMHFRCSMKKLGAYLSFGDASTVDDLLRS